MRKLRIKNVEEAIIHSIEYDKRYYGNKMQIKIDNHNEKFVDYCLSISYKSWADELKGFQRKRTTKEIDEIKKDSKMCGIKTYYSSIGSFDEWEKWEEGYIEFFLVNTINGFDYFIWSIIEMKHLKGILTEFKDELSYFYD